MGFISIKEIAKEPDFILLDNSVIASPLFGEDGKPLRGKLNSKIYMACSEYWINVLREKEDCEKIRVTEDGCREIVGVDKYSDVNVISKIQRSRAPIEHFFWKNERTIQEESLSYYYESKDEVLSCVGVVNRELKKFRKSDLSEVDIGHLVYGFALAREGYGSVVISNDRGIFWLWNNVSRKFYDKNGVDFYLHTNLGWFERKFVK
ncbi:MAG: hypothetical protein OQK82_06055 [Candidatus Pacearchaeota archaeon]|nr:hypothetical protein [Candidatus Pacearchaeota archaeon]